MQFSFNQPGDISGQFYTRAYPNAYHVSVAHNMTRAKGWLSRVLEARDAQVPWQNNDNRPEIDSGQDKSKHDGIQVPHMTFMPPHPPGSRVRVEMHLGDQIKEQQPPTKKTTSRLDDSGNTSKKSNSKSDSKSRAGLRSASTISTSTSGLVSEDLAGLRRIATGNEHDFLDQDYRDDDNDSDYYHMVIRKRQEQEEQEQQSDELDQWEREEEEEEEEEKKGLRQAHMQLQQQLRLTKQELNASLLRARKLRAERDRSEAARQQAEDKAEQAAQQHAATMDGMRRRGHEARQRLQDQAENLARGQAHSESLEDATRASLARAEQRVRECEVRLARAEHERRAREDEMAGLMDRAALVPVLEKEVRRLRGIINGSSSSSSPMQN